MSSMVLEPALTAAPAVAPEAPEEAHNPWTLRSLFATYRWRLLCTYGLFNLENLLHLAQPLVLGLAINDLLHSSYRGLVLFAGLHVSFVSMSVLRRMYDIRAFTGIYADLATRLVVEQRGRGVEVSRVAARSALSREVVTFFERDVPVVLTVLYSVAGGLLMLLVYDELLVLFCLALLVPVCVFNKFYARQTSALNRRLNDEFEREVEVITGNRRSEVREHYGRVGHWRVKLYDWEALNFSLMEVFILGLLAAALVRSCLVLNGEVGDIFAVFRYVWLFVAGLDGVPMLVQQATRLRDIGRRLNERRA
jgi:hypothetical protein